MLPKEWSLKMVDLNVEALTGEHLAWADMAFVSAMSIQSASAEDIICRCQASGVKVCVGGMYFTTEPERGNPVDHLFVGEAEETIPLFLEDLAQNQAQPVYRAMRFPDLSLSPIPRWNLIDLSCYSIMALQVSRGCPFNCDFCQVVVLQGRRPRYKPTSQVIVELAALLQAGWRGMVMFVDDNFICNHGKSKALLKALISWQVQHRYPFNFFSQVSVDLFDDPELIALMSRAGFTHIFLGIETPAAESLAECHKRQNQNRDMVASIRMIHSHGIEVYGGFIVGFDADPPDIFEAQARLIEQAAIPSASVGMLVAAPGTPLYRRLEAEGRVLGRTSGDAVMNLAGLNMVPKMGRERLISGYGQLVTHLYEPENFYRRVLHFFEQFQLNPHVSFHSPTWREVLAFFRILWEMGVHQPRRLVFWRFLFRVLTRFPRFFPMAVNFAGVGYHYHDLSQRFMQQAR
ncbi:MAG: B12-binding domain-containing radical SAM protein [Syntrophobacterales bacterium]